MIYIDKLICQVEIKCNRSNFEAVFKDRYVRYETVVQNKQSYFVLGCYVSLNKTIANIHTVK